jgi:hypothetical protein
MYNIKGKYIDIGVFIMRILNPQNAKGQPLFVGKLIK